MTSSWTAAQAALKTKVAADNEARAEDIAWMVETGESFKGAARRLGISCDALEKWMQRRHMYDEMATLRSRDPWIPVEQKKWSA